jgi:hypothetical protein
MAVSGENAFTSRRPRGRLSAARGSRIANQTYHDRVLGIAERLVREHPSGRDILALVLDDAGSELELTWDDLATSPTRPAY